MTNETYWYEEETLLSPNEHRIVFEAKVVDSDYLYDPNRYGEYRCVLQPLSTTDYQRFYEHGELALTTVERSKASYSRKVATAQYEDRYGMIVANQLNKPRVNIEVYSPLQLIDRDCSVNGFFRDLPNGNVVFNIDYIDFYDEVVEENSSENETINYYW